MRALFSLLPLLILFVSCSGKSPSKTSFNIEMNTQGLSSVGGLVIFGKEIGGKNGRFARVVTSTTITMDIPRGNWNIGGVAWDGANGPMTGTIVCGITSAILNEDVSTVDLNLQNATCFTPAISIESGVGGTPKAASSLNPNFCESDVGALSLPCVYDKLDYLITPKRGFVGSFRLSIPGGASFDGVPQGEILESNCFDPATNATSPGGAINLTTVNVPAFISGLGIPLHLDAYLGPACETNRGFLRLSFDNPNIAKFDYSGGSFKKFFGKTPVEQICSVADQKNAVGFASGNGSLTYPFVICTPDQLNYLAKNYSVSLASKSYILGRDLNLSSLSGAGANPADDCLDKGDTFVPIGMNFTPVTCVLNNDSNFFTGTFDGNGKIIKNFRFKDSSAPVTGFIDQLDGTISNMRFDKASIEGGNSTGIATGNISSTAQVYDIKVTNSDVRGEDDTGAIVGTSTAAVDMQYFKAKNVRVEGRNKVGGLVGYSSGIIKDSSFQGTVTSNYGSNSIGGIVGQALSQVQSSVSSGVLRGNSTMMGGIAGDGTSCLFCRSDMLIVDINPSTSTERRLGGIIGDGTSAFSSLFLGDIQTNCNVIGCKVGGLVGIGGAATPDSYTVQNMLGLGGANGTATTLSAVYLDNTIFTGLCLTAGAGCKWRYNVSDFPRIVNVDNNHKCASTVNNGAFTLQGTAGSEKDPHIICNPSQFAAISSTPSKYFAIEQSINFASFGGDTVGPFSGQLNGNDNVLFSHKPADNAVAKGLFTTISTTSSVRNLELAGFKYQSSLSCSFCNVSPLVQYNQGEVANVRVTDFQLSINDTTAKVGGIAALNTGTITNSSVSGSISCPNTVGGIVAQNQGTVTRNKSELMYIGGTSLNIADIGGVVGINERIVTQNTFKGKLDLSATLTSSRVGGIVGNLNRTTILTTVSDNHNSSKSLIEVNSSSVNVGGIVGFSNDATNVITRNVNSGLVYKPTNIATVSSILGAGAFVATDDLNFSLASTYGVAAPSTALSLTAPSDPLCDISVLTGTPFAGTYGAFRIMNETYFGPLSGSTNTWTLTITAGAAECTSSRFTSVAIGSIKVYNAWTPPEFPSASDLKNENFDVVDMTDPDDQLRAITAFIKIQEGVYPADAPVWISEEEGVKLFSQID